MVTPTMQKAVEALSTDKRLELVAYITSTIPGEVELTTAEKAMIRRRDDELDADESIGLDWKAVYYELMTEFQIPVSHSAETGNARSFGPNGNVA
jgi:hypothetical protein